MCNSRRVAFVAAAFVTLLCALPAGAAPVLEWTRQIGTSLEDRAYAIATDELGNSYVTGDTRGALAGPVSGISDAFLTKYDPSGNPLWTTQFGSAGGERSYGVAIDGFGSVYLSGATGGSFGGPQAGFGDAILSKFSADGVLQWTRQFGTVSSDVSNAVATDLLGNVIVSGYTEGAINGPHVGLQDAFLAKYDGAGNRLWARQLGSKQLDSSLGLSVDGFGNVYTTGFTGGDLVNGTNAVGLDAFLAKYDTDGNQLWGKQLGQLVGITDGIRSNGVAHDEFGNVYLSGITSRDFGGSNAGLNDAFLCKLDASGNLIWKAQLGTAEGDGSSGITTDGKGNVFIAGETRGDLGGPSAGNADMFLAKYDDSGNRLWMMQLGSAGVEAATGISSDGQGSVYISGFTNGSLGEANAGDFDIFVAKIHDAVPEPSSLALSMGAVAALWASRRRTSR